MNGWSTDYERGHFDGTHQERERIIALLEKVNIHCIDCMDISLNELGVPDIGNMYDRLFALIKGEQK